MAWTDTARRQHIRKGPRYPGDLRDGEWALIEPMFPAARSGGRPRTTCLRAEPQDTQLIEILLKRALKKIV